MSLLEDVLKDGFLKEEMQHAAVCVEARSSSAVAGGEAASDLSLAPLTESFGEYNARKSVADEELAECFSGHPIVLYGTLSHSHMSLCLRAFKLGAKWKIAGASELGFNACDEHGRLSVAEVSAHANCLDLVDLVQRGMLFEVLSWKMDVEQPDAASIISHALNQPQTLAMHQTEQQAIEVLNGLAIPQNAHAAQALAFSTVREKAREHLGHVVDDLEFVDLYEYCSNLGMGKTSFMQDLMQYMSAFVDPKKRRLKFSAFADANKLGLECPRLKVALIKKSYRSKPVKGICPNPNAFWSTAKNRGACLTEGEQLLHYMHVTAAPSMQQIDPKSRGAMLANVDIAVCTAFEQMTLAESKSQETVRHKLCMQVVKHASTWMQGNSLPKPAADADWVVDALLAASPEAAPAADEAARDAEIPKPAEKRPAESVHVPTVATFDEASGKMVAAPVGCTVPTASAKPPEAKKQKIAQPLSCAVDWVNCIRAAAKQPDQPGPDATHTGAVAFVMQHLLQQQSDDQEENSATSQGVSVLYEGSHFKVKAKWDLKPGELKLLPIVTSAGKIVAASKNPQALPVEVITIRGTTVAPDGRSSGEGSNATGSNKTDVKTGRKQKGKLLEQLGAVVDDGSVAAAVAVESAPPSDQPRTEKGTVYIMPDVKLPAVKKSPPSSASTGDVHVEWTGDEKVHPFWVIRRLSKDQLDAENQKNTAPARFNCEIKAKECHLVSIVGGTGCTKKVMVPMLTNHEAVRGEEELIIQHFPQKKQIALETHWTHAIKSTKA